MNLLEQFVSFLNNQKNPSSLTIKNYKADIGQFIRWFEKEFKFSFEPSKINLQILEQYKKSRNLSGASIERHVSSLRKFFHSLMLQKIILYNPLEKITVPAQSRAKDDPWKLKNFKNFLYEYKKSPLTIKNYVNDIKSFFLWLEKVSLVKHAWDVKEKNLLEKINFSVIGEYKQRLTASKFSPRTINRKLSSLRNYINWAKNQGLISEHSENPVNQDVKTPLSGVEISDNQTVRNSDSPSFPTMSDLAPSILSYSSFPPVRLMQKSFRATNFLFDNFFILPIAKAIQNSQYLFWKASGKNIFTKSNQADTNPIFNIQKSFYAPLDISIRYLPRHKKVWHYLHHVRPKWYNKYHSYSITHYFHFAILVILSTTIGFGIYNGFFEAAYKGNSSALAALNTPPRMLSFQGKLSDASNNPIANPANIIFSIYNKENASASAFLWKETNVIKPNPDGIFSILLGRNNPIPETLFIQNPELFLGITIGNTPELSPRQELATAFLSKNTQALQGLEPITNTARVNNVVLALDSSGNLNIGGSKTHTFQTIGGNFVLSGNVLSLTTVSGSNSNVEITPDGIGKIDFSKPIHNSTNNNNLLGVPGAVEFDDTVAILATSSAQSAFTINQNSIGPLISASASGIAKFTVGNDGTGSFGGNIEVSGGNIISSSETFNLLDSTVAVLNIGGAAKTINLGVLDTTVNVKSNLNVKQELSISSLTSKGGILYTNDSGKILQVSAGSTSDCLRGGETPSFSPCEASDSSQADIAEYYGSKDTTIESGDVVVIAPGALTAGKNSKAYVNKSDTKYQGNIIGIVSTNPYEAFGKSFGSDEYSFPVTLAGRIPVKITLENGPIKAGDLLTSSSIPGVAMKATQGGIIVGKALEDLDNIDDSKVVGFYDPDNNEYRNKTNFPNISIKSNIIRIAKIYAFANVSWYDPNAYLAESGDLIINSAGSNGYSVSNSKNETFSNIEGFFEVVAANIRTGLINASEIVANSLIVTSDSVIVGGQNLKDYIVRTVNESPLRQDFGGQAGIISPVIKTDRVATNIISPLAENSNISVSLSDSQFTIHDSNNATGSAVAAIDNQGNASFSGTIDSLSLETNDASVSGTLRAGSIFADSIQGLTNFTDIASYSGQFAYVNGLEAEQAQFNQGLMVFGSTSLSDLSIAGRLAVGGTMFVAENSIEALGTDLSIQSLRQGGLSIMSGLIYIDTEGNIKVQGDLSVSGKLAVNIISPLPTSDLVVNNASGSSVLSINQTGDVTASGSGTFAKLNFSLVEPVFAVSATEVIASSSAGVADIAPFQSEITIRNPFVTSKSVIYITPVGTPSAQTPFLMRQIPNKPASQEEPGLNLPNGSFTVGVQSPTKNPIPFNWLIVN